MAAAAAATGTITDVRRLTDARRLTDERRLGSA
jgi:hypothetical protein